MKKITIYRYIEFSIEQGEVLSLLTTNHSQPKDTQLTIMCDEDKQ